MYVYIGGGYVGVCVADSTKQSQTSILCGIITNQTLYTKTQKQTGPETEPRDDQRHHRRAGACPSICIHIYIYIYIGMHLLKHSTTPPPLCVSNPNQTHPPPHTHTSKKTQVGKLLSFTTKTQTAAAETYGEIMHTVGGARAFGRLPYIFIRIGMYDISCDRCLLQASTIYIYIPPF